MVQVRVNHVLSAKTNLARHPDGNEYFAQSLDSPTRLVAGLPLPKLAVPPLPPTPERQTLGFLPFGHVTTLSSHLQPGLAGGAVVFEKRAKPTAQTSRVTTK